MRRTDSDSGEETQQKPCRTSSDIGAEQENHIVGRGPTYDRKGLSVLCHGHGPGYISQLLNKHVTLSLK
jgi:hypothetical protein